MLVLTKTLKVEVLFQHFLSRQRRSTYRHSRAGGNPAALDSRLRGNDGMLVPATRLTPGFVLERRWRWERKVRKRFPTEDQFLNTSGSEAVDLVEIVSRRR